MNHAIPQDTQGLRSPSVCCILDIAFDLSVEEFVLGIPPSTITPAQVTTRDACCYISNFLHC